MVWDREDLDELRLGRFFVGKRPLKIRLIRKGLFIKMSQKRPIYRNVTKKPIETFIFGINSL